MNKIRLNQKHLETQDAAYHDICEFHFVESSVTNNKTHLTSVTTQSRTEMLSHFITFGHG